MSEDIARLGYEIDSSQAAGAARELLAMQRAAGKAAAGAAKLQLVARGTDGRFQSNARYAKENAAQLENLANKYNPVMAAQLAYARAQQEVATAVRLGVVAADQQSAVLERLQAQYMRTGAAANTMQAGTHSATNMLFQMQDVTMMAVSGQNALILGMQQGTQIAGIFAQEIAAGRRPMAAFAGGLRAMISPMSFLTIAAVAGGAALFQWAMRAVNAERDTRTFEEQIDDLTESLQNAEDGLGGMGDALSGLITLGGRYGESAQRIAEISRQLAFMEVTRGLNSAVDALAEANPLLDGYRQALTELGSAQSDYITFTREAAEADADQAMAFSRMAAMTQTRIDRTQAFLQSMAAQMELTTTEANNLANALNLIEAAEGAEAQAAAAARIREQFVQSISSRRELTAAEEAFLAALLQVEQASLRAQAIEERRSATIEGINADLQRQLDIAVAIQNHGEDSLEVQNLRNAAAQDELRLRLENQGATAEEVQAAIELLRAQQDVTSETERTLDAVRMIADADISSFEGRVAALALELGVAADEAARLLRNLPVGMNYGNTGALSDQDDLLPPTPDSGGGGGGGSAGTGQLEAFISSLMTQRETLENWRTEQLELLAQYNDTELAAIGGHNEARIRLEQEYQERLANIRNAETDRSLGIYRDFFGNMASLAQAGGERTLGVWKAFSIAQATIDSYAAFTQVLRDPFFIGRPFQRAIAAGSVLASGLAQVANIQNTSMGGGGGGGGAPSSAAGTSAPAQPDRIVRVAVDGPDWIRDMVTGIMSEIYEQTTDGTRVQVVR